MGQTASPGRCEVFSGAETEPTFPTESVSMCTQIQATCVVAYFESMDLE